MNVRERLIMLRDKTELSQQEFADRLGVTRQTVNRWESGRITPSLNQLAAICNVFDADANEILGCTEKQSGTDGQNVEGKTEEKRTGRRRMLPAIIALAVLLAAALDGLIATIVYAVKDSRYDAGATVWIITLPQNTPMIVLCVFLSILIALIAALFIYLIVKGRKG